MAETALAFAMKNAGVDTGAAQLYQMAANALHNAGRNVSRAIVPFVDEVRDRNRSMAALVPFETTKHFAYDYLARVREGMLREDLRVSAKAGDGVHWDDESHQRFGPVENSEGDGSDERLQIQVSRGPSSSDPVPSQDGGGVRLGDESLTEIGSPESREGEAVRMARDSQRCNGLSSSHQVRNGTVRNEPESHNGVGRVVPIPNKPRGLEAMEAQRAGNALMDTYLMLNGAKIGDLVWSSLPRLARTSAEVSVLSARQSALLKLIHGHITPADPNTRVRDLIKPDDLQRMIIRVEEIAQ